MSNMYFTDILPSGLVPVSGITTTCTCTSTFTTATTFGASGCSLAASSACFFQLSVNATSIGTKDNQPFTVNSNLPPGTSLIASLMVVQNPLTKTFNPNSIKLGKETFGGVGLKFIQFFV